MLFSEEGNSLPVLLESAGLYQQGAEAQLTYTASQQAFQPCKWPLTDSSKTVGPGMGRESLPKQALVGRHIALVS